MISFNDFNPGEKTRRVLLYFESINEFYIWDMKNGGCKEKPFVINEKKAVATHWMDLDEVRPKP